MSQKTQRFTSSLVLLALLVSTSAFAENRSRGRTDLEKLAAELEARLGRGSVVLERGRETPGSNTAPTAANAILAAMNRERASRGLSPLRINAQLSQAAGDRVHDMFAKRYFAHVAPDGLEPFVWASQRGYRYRIIGENLALGYRGTAVVDGWMRSPGHRENILQRRFDEVGIAVADGTPQRGYRGPLVVAMYGSR